MGLNVEKDQEHIQNEFVYQKASSTYTKKICILKLTKHIQERHSYIEKGSSTYTKWVLYIEVDQVYIQKEFIY